MYFNVIQVKHKYNGFSWDGDYAELKNQTEQNFPSFHETDKTEDHIKCIFVRKKFGLMWHWFLRKIIDNLEITKIVINNTVISEMWYQWNNTDIRCATSGKHYLDLEPLQLTCQALETILIANRKIDNYQRTSRTTDKHWMPTNRVESTL